MIYNFFFHFIICNNLLVEGNLQKPGLEKNIQDLESTRKLN